MGGMRTFDDSEALSTSAPAAINNRIISLCPSCAAAYSGVRPLSFVAELTSEPFKAKTQSNVTVISKESARQQKWRF